MFDDDSSSKRRRRFIKALLFIPFFLFIILFWNDVRETFGFFFRILLRYLGKDVPLFLPNTLGSLAVIGFNLFFGFSFFFLIWLYLTSKQALLPVSSLGETIQTALQLVFYMLKVHGPAVVVKNGILRADAEELRRYNPGVALVDSSSAIVLEQVSWASRVLPSVVDFLMKTIDLLRGRRDPVRVCGPGLIFIRFDERIQGVGDLAQESGPVEEVSGAVDLRQQFRRSEKQSNCGPELMRTSVCAYTRDGIELTTNISALFSIGQDPDKGPNVLHIVCDGDRSPENLRIVSLEEEDGAIRIQAKDDELDPDDRQEIFAYLLSDPALFPYSKVAPGTREPVFNPNRVFSAVYGRSRSQASNERILPWMDLPVKVAIDFFREILSHYNFDELYRSGATGGLKIDTLRAELRTRMRNCGVLNYRLVSHRRPGRALITDENGIFHKPTDLQVSPVRALQIPKVLRERGIKIVTAGFSDLVPTDDVYLQRLARWRADWERDTKAARAAVDLDTQRIYSRARARAQHEIALSFREIFENGRHPREALALRVLQALETIAADRETQRLLPADTISMLQRIHDWLLPGDIGFSRGNPARIPPDEDGE